MHTKHTLKYNTPLRKSRNILSLMAPSLLAVLFFVGANTALAEERHHKSRDYDRYDRHDKHDRHDKYDRRDKYDRYENRNRHDKSDKRHGKYDRYDKDHRYENRDRYDKYRRYDNYDQDRRYRTYETRRYSNRPGYYHEPYANQHRRFEIPSLIVHTHRARYKDYYHSRVYYEDHHHHHDIYRFPVYVEGSLTYRPYAYCEGKYFATGYFGVNGPHFSIRLNF